MKKFELFMCCLGNGITVFNKAVEEHGDYKMIAHISADGELYWRVHPENVPGEYRHKIEDASITQAKKFKRQQKQDEIYRTAYTVYNSTKSGEEIRKYFSFPQYLKSCYERENFTPIYR